MKTSQDAIGITACRWVGSRPWRNAATRGPGAHRPFGVTLQARTLPAQAASAQMDECKTGREAQALIDRLDPAALREHVRVLRCGCR
jgi:hypothetical protein